MSSRGDIILLVDFDNLELNGISPSAIVEASVSQVIDIEEMPGRDLRVLLRLYGGWYRRYEQTDQRQRASQIYSPLQFSLRKVRDRIVRSRVEFADSMVFDSSDGITHTVVSRSRQPRSKKKPQAPSCSRDDCALKDVRKWMRKGKACTVSGCCHEFGEQFVRDEQKQVDTHLASDLIWLAALGGRAGSSIILCSDDVDFIPPLATAASALREGVGLHCGISKSASEYIYEKAKLAGVNVFEVES